MDHIRRGLRLIMVTSASAYTTHARDSSPRWVPLIHLFLRASIVDPYDVPCAPAERRQTGNVTQVVAWDVDAISQVSISEDSARLQQDMVQD
jgi:hypothetical protein